MKLRKRYIWILVLCVYFAAVMALCLIKPYPIPELSREIWGIPLDKIVHFLMFFPYPIIAYIAFKPEDGRKWQHLLVLFALFTVGIGLAIGTEHLQGLTKHRSYDINDFYADVLGMECSAFLTALYILFRRSKRRKDL